LGWEQSQVSRLTETQTPSGTVGVRKNGTPND